MTEMLQKTENVAKNVANENSQDLTEQWKQGKLIGEYWCEITESPYPERVYLPTCDNDIIVKVLAPVPSYEEWQASEKYNKHLEEVIKTYERKEKQHTDDAIAYNELAKENAQLKDSIHSMLFTDDVVQDRYDKIKEENQKLKELLKECRPYVIRSATSRMIENSIGHKKDMKLFIKIDEVLK